ncbi:MAG TPA: 2-amino-4-hydroxy-6-hydroxymethyldihydropteridine diphosphokinase [Acidimicrobiales bacterium]|nr:2-amino-4-hydroxy-6-hydroxymethyldihydropteridine diphosphokinase [Acidimicrobiales bacterium]
MGGPTASPGPAGRPAPTGSIDSTDPDDRIEIRDLRVTGVHGVLPEERERAQPFAVDLDAWLDAAPAAASDALADTVDYGDVVLQVAAVVAGRSFQLLEALASELARVVLDADRRVAAVAVTVRKLRPPLPADVGSVGVRVVRRRPVRAFLGLGSNLGDRRALLAQAVATLREAGDVVAVSPVYETEPVGGPDGQGPYLNLVVELATTDPPRRLLERCRQLERAARRVRTVRFGPRTLDADVLLVGDAVVDQPDLQVPHPRLWERRFVVAPLADLAPDLVDAAALDAAGGQVARLGML